MIEIYLLIWMIVGAILANLSYGPLKRLEKRRQERYKSKLEAEIEALKAELAKEREIKASDWTLA